MTTALITGASSGIGKAFAEELARTGHDLVLVARDTARLEAVGHELTSAYGVHTEVLTADLAVRDQLERVAERLRADGPDSVDLLVNNAGFGLKTTFLDSDIADEERQLTVLCSVVLVLCHAAARAMVARGHGQIINVSSVASFITMGTYSAAKAWVTTFSQSLANDLEGTGVGVTALCPGYTRTEFHARMGASMKSVPAALWLEADDLVKQALADARRGRVLSVPGAVYQVAGAATAVLPRGVVRRISGALAGSKGALRERNGR